jgi:hypothetical protein
MGVLCEAVKLAEFAFFIAGQNNRHACYFL